MSYIIRHVASKNSYIEEVISPPRLSKWTNNLKKAQRFESREEAEATVDYIKVIAFNVECIDPELIED